VILNSTFPRLRKLEPLIRSNTYGSRNCGGGGWGAKFYRQAAEIPAPERHSVVCLHFGQIRSPVHSLRNFSPHFRQLRFLF